MTDPDNSLAPSPAHRLKILVVSSLLPYPPHNGGTTRLYNLYKRLGRQHDLTWASPVWDGQEAYFPDILAFCTDIVELSKNDQKPFPQAGWRHLLFRLVARLHWERLFVFSYGYIQAPGLYFLPASPERVEKIRQVLAAKPYDLIICEFEGTAELIPIDCRLPKVIDMHNTLSTLFERIRGTYRSTWEDRLFYLPELMKVIGYEKKYYTQFDYGLVCSDQDQQVLKQRCPRMPTDLIANGVDVHQFQPVVKDGCDNSLMYFGHYGYPPNADAIRYFCSEILPIIRKHNPHVRVRVVGSQPPEEIMGLGGVDVLGNVPDVREYLAQADVVVAPLRVGGGTRLKILESMAMAKAIVSTTLGAEGLVVTHGQEIMLADTPEDFAKHVLNLLNDHELRARLGGNARQLVERDYDWDAIAARMDGILTGLMRAKTK